MKTRTREWVQLSRRQLGVLTLEQCQRLGLTPRQVRFKIQTGEWCRLHHAVYLLAPGPAAVDQWEMAALLAAGSSAALSHFTAARRLKLDIPLSRTVHVSVPAEQRPRKIAGVKVWRTCDVRECDLVKRDAIRLTRVGRTLVDLAAVLDGRWMRATLDSAVRQDRRVLRWVNESMDEQGSGRPGIRRLRGLVAAYEEGADAPDSVLESFAMELGLGVGRKPVLHFNVHDSDGNVAEVDLAWPELRLCLELDSWRFHGDLQAFQRDRARDRRLMLCGWTVLRFTWSDVTRRPRAVVDEVARAYTAKVEGASGSRAQQGS